MASAVLFTYGAPALPALDALSAAGATVAAVVVPGNRSGPAVDRVVDGAARRGLPVWTQPPRSAIAPFVEQLRGAAPDVCVVWSYSMLLPQAVLDVPRHGTINVHAGSLPGYRGGHVIQWAIINGERESAATLHYVDAGVDTGPVIAEVRFSIGDQDDADLVRERLQAAGLQLLRDWWPRVAEGTAPRVSQDESKARYWPLRTPDQGRIDWRRPAEEICRLVRALVSNDPGAFASCAGGSILMVRRAQPVEWPQAATAPGQVLSVSAEGLLVAASDGAVLVSDAILDGRRLAGLAFTEVVLD